MNRMPSRACAHPHVGRTEAITNSSTAESRNSAPSRRPTVAADAILKRRMTTEMRTQAIPASRYAHHGPVRRLATCIGPDSTLELLLTLISSPSGPPRGLSSAGVTLADRLPGGNTRQRDEAIMILSIDADRHPESGILPQTVAQL